MKQALTDLFSSKKFLTALVALIVTVGAKYGLKLDDQFVLGILGLFAVLLGAQGAADHGKEAAQINADARTPEKGSAVSIVMLALAIAGFVFVASCGILSSSTAKGFGKDVVDCTTSSAKSTINQFGPVVASYLAHSVDGGGRIDWSSIKADTKSFGADVGGCVLASVVSDALHPKPVDPNAPKSSTLVLDPADLRAGFEDLRRSSLGGKTFHTEAGTL